MADDKKISVQIEAVTGGARAALTQFEGDTREFADHVSKNMAGMQKTLSMATLATMLRPAMDALAGLKKQIMETVGAAASWDKNVRDMARVLGVTTTEAGGLAKALGKLGADTSAYTGAAFQLQRALMGQEEALNANGIVTRDAAGGMLDMQQVMMNTLDRLRQMKPGYDANALAMMAFGRGAKELDGILKLTNGAIAEGTARVKEQGIEVGAGASAADAYRLAMADVNDTMEALKIKVGQELMPAVAGLSKSLAGIAQAVAPMLAAAVKALSLVTDHWKSALIALLAVLRAQLSASLSEMAATLIPRAIAGVRAFIASLGPIGLAMMAVSAGVAIWDRIAGAAKRAADAAAEYAQRTAGTTAKIRQCEEQLRANYAAYVKEAHGSEKASKLLERRAAIMDRLESLYPGYKATFDGAYIDNYRLSDAIDACTQSREKSLAMAAAKAERDLADAKAAKASKETIEALTRALEAYRAELDAVRDAQLGLGGAFVPPSAGPPTPTAPKPASSLPPLDPDIAGIGAARGAMQEGMAAMLAEMRAFNDQRRDLGLLALEDERANADHLVAMGQMTAERRLEIEQDFVRRENELRAIGADNALVANAEGLNRSKEATRMLVEEQSRIWRELGETIKQSVGDAIMGLLNGTMTWAQATTQLLNGVLQSMMRKVTEAALQELSLERMKLAFKKLFIGEEVAAKTAGAAEGAAAVVAGAGTEVGAKAVSAGAGAAASQSAIPIVGPALAIGAMAAVMAAVMALMGNLKSAAGGYWDVPHDMLANIHKDEMVLPAGHSAALRRMVEGGGEFGASQGPSVTLNVSAVDAKSFDKYMKQNRGGIIRQLKGMGRDFAFNG
jgi:hypothetical protein